MCRRPDSIQNQCRLITKPLKEPGILKECRAALELEAGLKEIIFATTAPHDTRATSKTLHGADGDIGAHLARRLQKRERERIGGDDGDRLHFMQFSNHVGEIVEGAGDAWVLKKRSEDLVRLQVFEGISDDDPPTERLRVRAHHGDRLR
jgi:hypothetical protein